MKVKLSELTVKAGDLHVSTDSRAILAIHGLGSCVGVAICDPVAGVAGLAHVFLPDSKRLTVRQRQTPWTCADIAIPELVRQARRHGAKPHRMTVVLAGGSTMGVSESGVGVQNQTACIEVLTREKIRIQESFMGGNNWRTIKVFVASGEVAVITSERVDVINHLGHSGVADASIARTRLENVDEVVDCLAPLAEEDPTSPEQQRRSKVVPQNSEEIAELLDHLLQEKAPSSAVQQTSSNSDSTELADLEDLLGTLIAAKTRLEEN